MMSVSKFAICVNIVLALLKIVAGRIFSSMSLLSDGLNSLSDLITNVLVIVGLKVGSNPEDKEHPFGHGKIESVFSVIIGTFIMITAFELIKDNFSKLTSLSSESNLKITVIPIIVTILAILIKIFQKRVNINFDERQDLRCHSLFDETLQIPIRELVLVVIDIKEKLNYEFTDNDLKKGSFENFESVEQTIIQNSLST